MNLLFSLDLLIHMIHLFAHQFIIPSVTCCLFVLLLVSLRFEVKVLLLFCCCCCFVFSAYMYFYYKFISFFGGVGMWDEGWTGIILLSCS